MLYETMGRKCHKQGPHAIWHSTSANCNISAKPPPPKPNWSIALVRSGSFLKSSVTTSICPWPLQVSEKPGADGHYLPHCLASKNILGTSSLGTTLQVPLACSWPHPTTTPASLEMTALTKQHPDQTSVSACFIPITNSTGCKLVKIDYFSSNLVCFKLFWKNENVVCIWIKTKHILHFIQQI